MPQFPFFAGIDAKACICTHLSPLQASFIPNSPPVDLWHAPGKKALRAVDHNRQLVMRVLNNLRESYFCPFQRQQMDLSKRDAVTTQLRVALGISRCAPGLRCTGDAPGADTRILILVVA